MIAVRKAIGQGCPGVVDCRLRFLQTFANYRLTFCRKEVLKSNNYIVCPLKLFVLILKRHVGGAKTFSYDDQTISLADKTKSFAHVN